MNVWILLGIVGVLFLIAVVKRYADVIAPVGYEDEDGFHYGKRGE
jgi:hypothetical protein